MSERPSLARFLRIALLAAAQLVTSAAAITAAVWLVGRIASDRTYRTQWLLWMPTPILLAALLAGFILAFRPCWHRDRSRRPRVIAWGILLLLGLAFFGLREHRLLRGADPNPGGVRLFHWALSEQLVDRPERFAAAILQAAPDLAVVTNAGYATVKLQRAQLAEAGYAEFRHRGPFTIVSRLPVLTVRPIVAADDGAIQVSLLEVDAGAALGRSLRLWLVDLPSDPRIPRHRLARRVREMLASSEEEAPDVIVGDMNMTRGSAAIEALFPGYANAFDQGGHGYGATFPRHRPFLHIDQVLLADGLRCPRYDILDPGVGRHRAQLAWIAAAPE